MAVLKNLFIAASVLASSTLAVPLAGVHKRDMVMQTHTDTVWVTQSRQVTVLVDGSGKPVKTDVPFAFGAGAVQPTPSSSSSSAYVAPSSSYSAPAAPSATSATVPSAPAPVASSSSTAPSPTYSPAGFAAQESPSPSSASSSSAPATVAAAPAPSSTQLQQKSSGPCEGQGSGCSGDITHWDGGLGACGWNVNTNSDMQIALPYELMGTQSNGNPYCGRSLTIQGPAGNLVQATVGDKCMGCTGDSIDLTDILFTTVAPSGDGRVHNIQWWFN